MAAENSTLRGNRVPNKTSLINDIKKDQNKISELYEQYKEPFYNWARFHFSLDPEEIKDIFQDTVIGFYKNIVSGKIKEIDYSIKTYLFSIGKNLILNRIKSKKRFDSQNEELDKLISPNPMDLKDVSDEAKLFVHKKISGLGEPCRTILELYYYRGYSLEAIRREIKSKNSNVVKAQKSRCIKALRLMLKEKFRFTDFFN